MIPTNTQRQPGGVKVWGKWDKDCAPLSLSQEVFIGGCEDFWGVRTLMVKIVTT